VLQSDAVGQIVPMIGDFPVEMLPIIEAGPSKCFFVNAKPKRSYQPQFGIQGYACSPYGSRVAWNFGLEQNDIQDWRRCRNVGR
jgi:hypothetical protein